MDVLVLDFDLVKDRSMADIHNSLNGVPANRLALAFTPDPSNPSFGPNFAAFTELFASFIIVQPPSVEPIVALKVAYPSCTWFIDLRYLSFLERSAM